MRLKGYWVAVGLGLAVPVHLSGLLSNQIIVAIGIACVFAWPFRVFRHVALVGAGVCFSCYSLQSSISRQLPINLEGEDLLVAGYVVGLPAASPLQLRFNLHITHCWLSGEKTLDSTCDFVDRVVRLSHREGEHASHLSSGQRYLMRVRLRRPRGLVNPGGFDYQAWLLHRGVSASGYVRGEVDVVGGRGCLLCIDAMRQALMTRLFSNTELKHHALLGALLVGDKSQLSSSQWKVLSATGTSHLMAISGLHVGLIAVAVFGVSQILIASLRLAFASAYLRYCPHVLSILFTGLYALLAGFEIPTKRAFIVVALFHFARISGRRTTSMYLLGVAAVLNLAIDPFASMQGGFWLSFAAAFILVYGLGGTIKQGGAWRLFAKAQMFIFVGLAAVLALLGLPVSVLSPLANATAVPWVSFIVIPLLMVSALLSLISNMLSGVLVVLCDSALGLLWWFLERLSAIDNKVWLGVPPSFLNGGLVFVALILVLSPSVFRVRGVGICLLLMLYCQRPAETAGAKISVLDVGQGLAIVLQSEKNTAVYDVGAKFSSGFDIGSRVLAPYLIYRGVERLDLVVVSHGDNDHAGGLAGLLEYVDVNTLAYNQTFDTHDSSLDGALRDELFDTNLSRCQSGMTWVVGQMKWQVLWPPAASDAVSMGNNGSCVVLVSIGKFTLLLAGDIERESEQMLIAEGVLPRNIDVLVAPHHGSRTSSTAGFLAHLNPSHVIFSAGYKNRYHHPAADVVARYRARGVRVWSTNLDGAITVDVDTDGSVRIFSERIRHPKPWY